MIHKKKSWAISLLLATICVALGAGQASSNMTPPQQLAGSWIASDTDSGARFYLSFAGASFGGTYTVTAPNSSVGVAHGSWIRRSATTFDTTDFAPIYDANGNIVQEQKVRARVEFASDPNSFVAELFIEIRLLDGTLVDSFSITVTGTRILIEPLP